MRINKFVALATGKSRRETDRLIADGLVQINNQMAELGQDTAPGDLVTLEGHLLTLPSETTTIMLNKPKGYVTSRDGQGSQTIYDLLPAEYHQLKPIGRLDKDSSGLLLLTNNGKLAHELTHPSFQKTKTYEVALDKNLQPLHRQMISDKGLMLADGLSKLELERIEEGNDKKWRVRMSEGRNRQIRRTFASLGYGINSLHRTHFGNYALNDLLSGKFAEKQI
jgi:23S rRNA pseudouridine2605 synthase